MPIVTDPRALRVECLKVKDKKEGGEIARRLWAELTKNNKRAKRPLSATQMKRGGTGDRPLPQFGLGLAAVQIGVARKVCVLNVASPLVLVNPAIVAHSDQLIPFREGCLSLPGKQVETWRYAWVVVEADNHDEPLVFGPRHANQWTGMSVVESVVAQHEVAHTYSLLMDDFVAKPYPSPSDWEAFGRERRAHVGSNGDPGVV